jgi:hypothetical protein
VRRNAAEKGNFNGEEGRKLRASTVRNWGITFG